AWNQRLAAAQAFLLGQNWLEHRQLGLVQGGGDIAAPPDWLRDNFGLLLSASLGLLLALGVLGWRWGSPRAWHSRRATPAGGAADAGGGGAAAAVSAEPGRVPLGAAPAARWRALVLRGVRRAGVLARLRAGARCAAGRALSPQRKQGRSLLALRGRVYSAI